MFLILKLTIGPTCSHLYPHNCHQLYFFFLDRQVTGINVDLPTQLATVSLFIQFIRTKSIKIPPKNVFNPQIDNQTNLQSPLPA